MEVKRRRKYSKEFQENIMNMLKTGNKNVPTLSKELGIAEQRFIMIFTFKEFDR